MVQSNWENKNQQFQIRRRLNEIVPLKLMSHYTSTEGLINQIKGLHVCLFVWLGFFSDLNQIHHKAIMTVCYCLCLPFTNGYTSQIQFIEPKFNCVTMQQGMPGSLASIPWQVPMAKVLSYRAKFHRKKLSELNNSIEHIMVDKLLGSVVHMIKVLSLLLKGKTSQDTYRVRF